MEGPREHTARGQGPTGGGWAARGSGPRGQLFPQSCDVRSRPALVRGCGSLSHRGRMDVPSPVRSHPCLGRGSPERPPGTGVPRVTAQDQVSVGPGGHRPACPTLCIYSRLPAEVRGPGRGVEGEAGPAGGPALSPGLGVLSCQTLGSPTWFQKGTLTAKKMRSMGGRHEGKEPLSRDGGRGAVTWALDSELPTRQGDNGPGPRRPLSAQAHLGLSDRAGEAPPAHLRPESCRPGPLPHLSSRFPPQANFVIFCIEILYCKFIYLKIIILGPKRF